LIGDKKMFKIIFYIATAICSPTVGFGGIMNTYLELSPVEEDEGHISGVIPKPCRSNCCALYAHLASPDAKEPDELNAAQFGADSRHHSLIPTSSLPRSNHRHGGGRPLRSISGSLWKRSNCR